MGSAVLARPQHLGGALFQCRLEDDLGVQHLGYRAPLGTRFADHGALLWWFAASLAQQADNVDTVSLADSPLQPGSVTLVGQPTGASNAVNLVRNLVCAAGARVRRRIVGAKRAGALREGDQAAVRAEEVQLCERRAARQLGFHPERRRGRGDRKSTRLNSSHLVI